MNSNPIRTDEEERDDADAILAELEAEADDDLASLRQERIISQSQELQPSTQRTNRTLGANPNTATSSNIDVLYMTLKSDDATLQFTTEHDKALLHFFHPDFSRCAIMDAHLEKIASRQADLGRGSEESEVHFGRVDVSHAPFVVERMGIRVLPCVIGFVKGSVKGRIVGFEGLCWDGKEKDVRVCQAVEERLVDWKLLQKSVVGKGDDDDEHLSESEDESRHRTKGRRGIQGRKQQIEDENDDWD